DDGDVVAQEAVDPVDDGDVVLGEVVAELVIEEAVYQVDDGDVVPDEVVAKEIEYECSSLALDREERRDEKKRLDHLKQDQTMLVIKRFSERNKDFKWLSGGRQAYKGAATRLRSCFCLFVENVVSELGGEDRRFYSNEEEVVPKVDDVSLVDGVFDGAFGREGEEDVVMGEGMVVTSSSLEMLTNSCLGGIIVSLIFLEGLEEEA
ncbi:hypothetical protein Tco_1167473, partial [Tanacetum coccineum]